LEGEPNIDGLRFSVWDGLSLFQKVNETFTTCKRRDYLAKVAMGWGIRDQEAHGDDGGHISRLEVKQLVNHWMWGGRSFK
jgi:hypothetical protein